MTVALLGGRILPLGLPVLAELAHGIHHMVEQGDLDFLQAPHGHRGAVALTGVSPTTSAHGHDDHSQEHDHVREHDHFRDHDHDHSPNGDHSRDDRFLQADGAHAHSAAVEALLNAANHGAASDLGPMAPPVQTVDVHLPAASPTGPVGVTTVGEGPPSHPPGPGAGSAAPDTPPPRA